MHAHFTASRAHHGMRPWLLILMLALALGCTPKSSGQGSGSGKNSGALTNLESVGHEGVEVTSEYSRILVEADGSIRTLYFIRDSGEVVVESRLDVSQPEKLQVPYTQTMFASYLFKREQSRALIIGLGGGSMVHFLTHYFPDIKVDAVEIDGEIVKIADRYFGARTGGNVRIFTRDGFEFLREAKDKYDTIYMDAFLKPSEDTDSTGVPLRLKTLAFLKDLQTKLTKNGMVVFNINHHRGFQKDIETIQRAFPYSYRFSVPRTGNTIVVGATHPKPFTIETLKKNGQALDKDLKASFKFEEMASRASVL